MSDDPQDWYFTFGAGQEHDHHYVCVKNSTFGDARMKMIKVYGIAWSGQYSVQQFLHLGLERHLNLLREID